MENLVEIQNGEVVVSSLDVAERFGKRHDHVLRDIETLIGGLPKSGDTQTMFHLDSYTNKQNGQSYPIYLMNRDGFSLLVMGFKGKKALDWKLKYIKAFNRMEKELNEVRAETIRHEAIRLAGKEARKELTANIAKFKCEGYGQRMTGITIGKWTNYIYLAVFGMKANEIKNTFDIKSIRDYLDPDELAKVDGAETMCSLMIREGKSDEYIRETLKNVFGIVDLNESHKQIGD